MHMRRKYVTHACMKAHISEHVYGEKPYMSKRKASKRRFCEWVLNRVNYHVKSHQGEADGSFEGSINK
mgnify:CR=1 FL=1